MVLKLAQALVDDYFPFQYAWHILLGLVGVIVLRAFSQGRTTTRERDLHDRTFLVTGGFTPLGLTLLQSLAERGAKIITLSSHPIDSPAVTILVSLLRTTYNNQHIFAEQCDLNKPTDIRKFCTRFLTEGESDSNQPSQSKDKNKDKPKPTLDTRLDGIIFAHEYQHIGVSRLLRSHTPVNDKLQRESNSLATFLITTLLLPVLLVAPVERDIRIINVINPFYAAATASVRVSKSFDPTFKLLTSPLSSNDKSIFLTEGLRSLRTIIFTRHLQRIFDALPNPQVPKTEEGSSTIPVISGRMQRSNIVAVSVSPGLSRVDTISRLFNADWSLVDRDGVVERRFSWIGVLLYILLLPFLHLSTKSPRAAIQSILHALFLPTPFKVLSQSINDTKPSSKNDDPPHQKTHTSLIKEEILKPGSLYAECAVVKLDIPIPQESSAVDSKDKGKAKSGLKEEVLQIDNDGEYGGEVAGRVVWEAYETALKVWEKGSTW